MTATSLGQYELITRIAHGGMAEIYLAKRRGPGGFDKRVVIKRVLPHLCENPEFVQMFLDEARLASRLSHPNIVQIFDFGQLGETYYLCMEHLDGEDLATVLRILRERGDPMPPQVAACLLSAACDGMHYAHTFHDEDGRDLKIVHRDLSPSNLFMTAQGAVKVLDFGIAKMEGKATQTQSGVVKGKFAYLSPEQANSEPVDARSDVYALGLILSEALTGVKVFKREGEAATLRAVLTETVPSPRGLRPDLPHELERVVMKACARAPEDRWPTAQAMRAALDDYLANRGSVPAASVMQTFMLGILGSERRGQGAPTPTASMLKATSYEKARTPSVGAPLDRATDGGSLSSVNFGTLAATPLPLSADAGASTTTGRVAGGGSGGTEVDPSPGSPFQGLGPADTLRLAQNQGQGQGQGQAEAMQPARQAPTAAYAAVATATRPRRSILWVACSSLLAVLVVGAWALWPHPTLESSPSSGGDPVAGGKPTLPASIPASTEADSSDAGGGSAATALGLNIAAQAAVAAKVAQAAELGAGGTKIAKSLNKSRPRRPHPRARNRVSGKTLKHQSPAALVEDKPKAQPGLLNVNCDPWCHVFVDGKDTGENSPAVGLRFPAGKHHVKVLHEATGMTREKDVTLIAGKTASVRIRF